jgi:hypothetical protein
VHWTLVYLTYSLINRLPKHTPSLAGDVLQLHDSMNEDLQQRQAEGVLNPTLPPESIHLASGRLRDLSLDTYFSSPLQTSLVTRAHAKEWEKKVREGELPGGGVRVASLT